MRIALIGTRGVPARYGGFETAVEEVGRRLVEAGHEVVVYSRRGPRSAGAEPLPDTYLGMALVHLPAVRHKVLETLSHTTLSVLHVARERIAGRRFDAAVVFNAANSPLLPVLRALRLPVATHVDGLEWKRAKWSGAGKTYYRLAESLAVRWSDALIADARGIEEYYRDEFDAPTEYIAYGAPQLTAIGSDRLADLGLTRHGYHLVVARFEPENHVRMVVEGYVRSGSRLPLVVVGSAPYGAAYTARIETAATRRDGVRLVGPVWDQALLDQLYRNCLTYVHGHSVGGTNPSLLRAMGAGAASLAYDVGFNREVLGSAGRYFGGPAGLAGLLEAAELDVDATLARGRDTAVQARRYDWDGVAEAYEKLCDALANGERPRRRPSGRRTGAWTGNENPEPVSGVAVGVRPRRGTPVDVGAGRPAPLLAAESGERVAGPGPDGRQSSSVDVGPDASRSGAAEASAAGSSPATGSVPAAASMPAAGSRAADGVRASVPARRAVPVG